MNIEKVTHLPTDIESLVEESNLEGFRFLQRLVIDFNTGENLFNKRGEALFAVYDDSKLIGIGGVNRNGSNNTTGRIRRVYISSKARSHGIGKLLMCEIEKHASRYFNELQLFTDTLSASKFYESIGYESVEIENVSHRKSITV